MSMTTALGSSPSSSPSHKSAERRGRHRESHTGSRSSPGAGTRLPRSGPTSDGPCGRRTTTLSNSDWLLAGRPPRSERTSPPTRTPAAARQTRPSRNDPGSPRHGLSARTGDEENRQCGQHVRGHRHTPHLGTPCVLERSSDAQFWPGPCSLTMCQLWVAATRRTPAIRRHRQPPSVSLKNMKQTRGRLRGRRYSMRAAEVNRRG